jgi:hypothetical protein
MTSPVMNPKAAKQIVTRSSVSSSGHGQPSWDNDFVPTLSRNAQPISRVIQRETEDTMRDVVRIGRPNHSRIVHGGSAGGKQK